MDQFHHDLCFDLSRSIDLHQISTSHTNEKAVAGTTTGLIILDEFVTWQAKHAESEKWKAVLHL